MNARRAALAALAAALMITSVAAAVAADAADPGQNFDPTWSPDGRRIAFAGDGKIYVMNADGSGKRRLTAGTAGTGPRDFRPDGGPAWSPDGRKIVFGTLRHAGPFACSDGHPSAGCNWEVYVMNADGSGQRRLTRNAEIDNGATWSPDGRKLLFHRAVYRSGKRGAVRGVSGLWIMNADGSGQRRLAVATGTAAWSPDSRMIAFSRGSGDARDIYVINADGSGQRRLTHSAGMDVGPTWSPDGRKIAFVSRRELCPSASFGSSYVCRNAEIYVMNADGTGQRNLTRNPVNGFYSAGAWSPDGKKMAFACDRDGNAEIYVMNADGSAQRRLTRNPASDVVGGWSPDGRKIAFVRGTDGLTFGSEIYVMNADGSGQQRLAP